jgi:predicted SprT family Zn-dependent metalloprotease
MQSIGVNILEHFIQKLTLIEIIDLFMNYNEFYSYKPNTYSYREVNNNIQHIKFCTCVKIAITLTRRWLWDCHINDLYKFT